MSEYTLAKLARELGVTHGDIYRAAVDLKVHGRKLGAKLTATEVDRLRSRFVRTAPPEAGTAASADSNSAA